MDSDKIQLIVVGENYIPNFDIHQTIFEDQFEMITTSNEEKLQARFASDSPSILVLDPTSLNIVKNYIKTIKEKVEQESVLIIAYDLNSIQSLSTGSERELVYESLEFDAEPARVWHVLQNARAFLLAKQEIKALSQKLELQAQELYNLNQIGIALSAQHDLDELLSMILQKSREITNADAGSLYLVEVNPDIPPDENDPLANKQLRFKLSHNDSLNLDYNEFVMPIEKKSMAGYVALTGEPLNIADAYEIAEDSEFSHNRSFDESTGYITKSILGIPMKTHKEEIIGVLQLINRKKDWDAKLTTPEATETEIQIFDEKSVHLASSLASQAAVSIENTRLYEEIKRLFEGFIRASVHAIEQRDPTTYGHSERVATLSVGVAKVVDKVSSGPYSDLHFSKNDIQQINYAGLLHDFGKIGVREHVLVKAKKLYPAQLSLIKARFKYIKKAIELNFSQQKVQHFLQESRAEAMLQNSELEGEFLEKIKELDNYLEFIVKTNEPTILEKGGFEQLMQIAQLSFQENGHVEHYLNDEEVHLLSITRGSLSEEERKEIESHVVHTYKFLSKIPWTSELKSVPDIAHFHHEKLDGSGYPLHLKSEDIPVQSKMMAIADIYDALTAWDRPYKKAMPAEKALDILGYEVKDGKLDAELYKLFLDAEVYKLVTRPE